MRRPIFKLITNGHIYQVPLKHLHNLSACPYLEAWDVIQARELLYVPTPDVEACPVPGTSHPPITQVTLGQWGSVMGTLVSDGGELAVLVDQEGLGVSYVHLTHPVRDNKCVYLVCGLSTLCQAQDKHWMLDHAHSMMQPYLWD